MRTGRGRNVSRASGGPLYYGLLLVAVAIPIALGLYAVIRQAHALRQMTIAAYQQTELEIVRAVARSVREYGREQLVVGSRADLDEVEQEIFRQFIAPVRLQESGDAWIYAPDHVVFDLSSDFPAEYRGKSMAEIFALQVENGAGHYEAMVDAVTAAREGVGWYVWLPDKGREIAAWTPVRVGESIWTIGLSTPLPEILVSTGVADQLRTLTIIVVTGAIITLGLLVTWGVGDVRRRRAEAERERLMSAIEQAAETVVITDPEAMIQYVNPAFERTTGYTREDAIGRKPSLLKSGEHDDAFYAEMWTTLVSGETWSGRIVNRNKDCALFTEEVVISPVRDGSGKTVNYVAVQRDVTQEIELEDQLRHAQKMEAVGKLVGGIAHDFNNVLQVINGHAELALAELSAGHPALDPVDEVVKAGRRATRLISQLLAFSRRQVLDVKDVNLNDLIAHLMKMIHRVIGEHIALDIIAGDDLGTVRVDPGQVEQILMNLCLNARDAMPEGGTITIETRNVQIDEEYRRNHIWAEPGWYVQLSVTDTGCGMDERTRANAFEPFFTTKDVGEGTGLGLSTVYGLVRQHRGMIDLSSEVGGGTTVTIYLHLVDHSTTIVADEKKGPVPGGSETILVAEDNEAVLKIVTRVLRGAGYTVLSAENGEEAVGVFKDNMETIDLALFDIVMPKLGGERAMARVQELRPDMPHLFLSGYSDSGVHTSFIQKKGLHLLQKPFQLEELLRKVREVLDV